MELSPEDALRINVLLSNRPLAVRIHDARMRLDGLLADREVSIQLNPTGDGDHYLRAVRALLSEYALGTPGGYPLYLQRWTRMGTMRDESLEQLLLLGEPTAVFAVVCAKGLTDELARRAWWAVEEAENARRMLETREVVEGQTGKQLARFLVEFLPFETESEKITSSVAMAVQPGLLSEAEVAALWQRSTRRGANLLGFLKGRPHDLPLTLAPRVFPPPVADPLAALAAEGNPWARQLIHSASPARQAFIDTCLRILAKPASQDLVAGLVEVLAQGFSPLRPEGDPDLTLPELEQEAREFVVRDPQAAACLALDPQLVDELCALRLLSGLGYGVLRPIFRRSDAIGSLMRRQLQPVLDPLGRHLRILAPEAGAKP